MSRHTLDERVQQVVQTGRCSGSGRARCSTTACEIRLSSDGYLRPARVGVSTAGPGAVREFDRACPGRMVRAQHPQGSSYHPILGPVGGLLGGRRPDPALRHRGSSGGVLTALAAWLVESGEAVRAVGAGADPAQPRRTVPVTIVSRQEALAAAGSRYAPVAGRIPPAGAQRRRRDHRQTVRDRRTALARRGRTSAAPALLLLRRYPIGRRDRHHARTARGRRRPGPSRPSGTAAAAGPAGSPRRQPVAASGPPPTTSPGVGRSAPPSSGAARSARTGSGRAATSRPATSGAATSTATPCSRRPTASAPSSPARHAGSTWSGAPSLPG